MKKALSIFFLAINVFCPAISFASNDYEIRESRKCSSIFYYFEKKYRLPTNSLHSISLHETAKKHSRHNISLVWPWTVMNNKEGKSFHFNNQSEAIKYVRDQFKLGNNNLDVGCMQINLKHHPEAFISLQQAFSPNLNVAYGAHFLKENIKKLGSVEKAIGRYHSATEHLALKYRTRVIEISKDMQVYKTNLKEVADNRAPQKYLYARALYKSDKSPKVKVRVGNIQNNDWFRRKNTELD